MNDFRPDHRPRQVPPRRFLSLILTIAVHIGLAVLLFFGINWQSRPLGSLEIELVSGPPAPAPISPPSESPPPEPPKAEPPPPEPPKPEPPKEEPKPEIATKKQEKPKQEPPKPEKKPERKPPEPPLKPIDLSKQLDQKLNQAIKRSNEEKKVNDLLTSGQQGKSTRVSGTPGELDAYRLAIAAKVRRNLISPPGLSGNPEALFEIEQIKGGRGGEIVNIKLKKSSGNRALDEAIERAIRKSDPLPLPDNPNLFTRTLEVTFRPLED
ncbi:MAG: TonB C-terminal domain-containing protein [Betaproteobacteria bacterium]|nr:TonB C-terminal domain-containing protein [Betaproteobacteria bacterium]